MSEATEPYAYCDEVAELLAGFTAGVSGKLTPAIQHAAKRALGDSIAVSLGALAHPAFKAALRHAARFPMANGPVIWGTTLRSTPDIAALANGVLLRCYDYNDFFVGQRNSGHPSDMVSGLVVAAEWAGASGEELLSALAVGYEMVGAMFDAFSTAPGGWDYTNLTAVGAASAIARVLKLDAEQTREALAMTVVPHFASDEVESCELNRRGDLTMWKRFNGSDSVRNALQACLLASVGVEGAVRPFTGKQGFVAKLKTADDPLPILRERLSVATPLSRIADTYMKLWPVGSMAQSAIRAALEARAQVADIARIKQVRVFAEEGAYQHFVTMRQDPWHPISRETADHSMPYIVAAAVLDGHIGIESFDLDRVLDPVRQAFLREKVVVTPAPELGTLAGGKLKRAEAGYLSRVEIETVDGKVVHGAAKPFPGHPRAPFSDADLEQKVRANAAPFMDAALIDRIVAALAAFERVDRVSTFTSLLAFDLRIRLEALCRMSQQAARARLYGHRARIGYTSPPLFTEVFPYEFYRIVPDGVTLVLTTVGVIQPDKANINQAYENTMTAARAIARSGVDVVVLGGQPINMARGAENADQVIRDLEAELNVKVSTSAAAQKKAALALGCRKVVIAQPYGPEENARQSGYAASWGCEVLGVTGWGSTLAEFGGIPRDAALVMGRALLRQHPEADAILLPSPNWPTIDAIEPLEREFGIRVMTASQAATWDALRLAGIPDRIPGYGRLLAEL